MTRQSSRRPRNRKGRCARHESPAMRSARHWTTAGPGHIFRKMSDISSHASIRTPAPPARSRVFFDAVLLPHRSLGPRGFRILMLVAGGGACVIGTSFMLMGAWPVTGFCGLEILLLYIAFRLNYRSGRAYRSE